MGSPHALVSMAQGSACERPTRVPCAASCVTSRPGTESGALPLPPPPALPPCHRCRLCRPPAALPQAPALDDVQRPRRQHRACAELSLRSRSASLPIFVVGSSEPQQLLLPRPPSFDDRAAGPTPDVSDALHALRTVRVAVAHHSHRLCGLGLALLRLHAQFQRLSDMQLRRAVAFDARRPPRLGKRAAALAGERAQLARRVAPPTPPHAPPRSSSAPCERGQHAARRCGAAAHIGGTARATDSG